MQRRSLLVQLVASFCLIVLASLTLVTWFSLHTIRTLYLEETADRLTTSAALISSEVNALAAGEDWDGVQTLVSDLSKKTHTRFTVVLPNGKVVADSNETPSLMGPHLDRPEIRSAIQNGQGLATRYSATLQETMMYAAIVAKDRAETEPVIRAAMSLAFIDQNVSLIVRRVLFVGILIAIVAVLVSLWLARRISRPVETMTQAARRFAQGDFQDRIPAPQNPELAELSSAMNTMAAELNLRLQTIDIQAREKEAIFKSMDEGVLAIDTAGRLISVNRAAAKMLNIDPNSAEKRRILELIRSTPLQEFIDRSLKNRDTVSGEILLTHRADLHVQVRGTALEGENGKSMGVLIVLHDITHVRRLEHMRKEFVANVSHELKTPVTSIQGFAETLLDENPPDPETSDRFLRIIRRQAKRLSQIIEDLLSLSRIERHEDEPLPWEPGLVPGLMLGAIEICQSSADEKSITITPHLDVPSGMEMNVALIEQALVNLIDNAIKYGPEDSQIKVSACLDHSDLVLAVEDNGPGIPEAHLSRLFERFYRVDKGRSREVGGTGLGLAIVKHIALSHGGSVHVKSTLGTGTIFRLVIPQADTP